MRIIRIVFEKLYPIYSEIIAFLVYHCLIRIQKENEIILVLHQFIGDQLYALSCIDLMKTEYPECHICVLTPDNNKKIISTFCGIDRWIFLPKKGFKYVCVKCFIRNKKYSKIALKYNIINTTPFQYKCFEIEDGNVRNILCRKLYKLNEVEPITYHNIEKVQIKAIQNFSEIKDRVAIINPYSNSISYSKELYEKLCAVLVEEGYIVYTNIIGNQEVLSGSQELRCSLEELYSIACQIPLFVTVRSGVADLLISSTINMFVLYEITNSLSRWISEHYSLQEWKPKGKVQEVIATDIDPNTVCIMFKDYLKTI